MTTLVCWSSLAIANPLHSYGGCTLMYPHSTRLIWWRTLAGEICVEFFQQHQLYVRPMLRRVKLRCTIWSAPWSDVPPKVFVVRMLWVCFLENWQRTSKNAKNHVVPTKTGLYRFFTTPVPVVRDSAIWRSNRSVKKHYPGVVCSSSYSYISFEI